MDDSEVNETSNKSANGCAYVICLLAWFFVGGFISWIPLLSHGVYRVAGELATNGSIIFWGGLPFTIGFWVFSKDLSTSIFVIFNLVCWLFCAGWVWFSLWIQ